MKLCVCCHNRPVGAGKQKYCSTCAKHIGIITQARRRGKDISQLWFTGNKLCECCGKNPIGTGHTKYCDHCAEYTATIWRLKTRGKNLHQAKFNRLCECCGERPVAKNKQKYCSKCAENPYKILLEKDLKKLDRGEKLQLCSICGIRERIPGVSICRVCKNRQAQARYAKSRGSDYKKPTSNLCIRCHQYEKYAPTNYCYECLKYNKRIYQYTGRNINFFKPVANPQVYYTEASMELTCPICRAESCLSGLPLGRRCKHRILKRPKCTTWQDVLKLQGIRIPTLEEISPEVAKIRSTCCQCKTNPRMTGYLYCQECYTQMLSIHKTPFKAILKRIKKVVDKSFKKSSSRSLEQAGA